MKQKALLLKQLLCSLVCITLLGHNGLAQTASSKTTNDVTNLFNLSLEELLDIEIVSASREKESSFDVPVSSFVISKQEIVLSGATSIPDALKICPGVIVREVTNGNYDVSLRGGIDGYPAYNHSYSNKTILVMIDSRPVFSHLEGGTLWQNLPVGLADIERIEVVHGPSAPLYGPNAVSGVINIITSTPSKEDDVYTTAHVQGNHKNIISSALIGKQITKTLSIDISANYEARTRFDDSFYGKGIDGEYSYLPISDIITFFQNENDRKLRYPNLHSAIEKVGAISNLHYEPSEDIKINLQASFNQNNALTPLRTGLSLSTFTNQSQSIYLNSSIYGMTFQASYLKGLQGLTGDYTVNQHKYSNSNIYIDYNISLLKDKLSVKPSVSYQSAYANDKEFTVDVGKEGQGTFNAEGIIHNIAGSIRLDATPIKNTRVTVAGRYDKFSSSDKGTLSYQASLNYKVAKSHSFRFVTGKSHNSTFLIPTLINSNTYIQSKNPSELDLEYNLVGNSNLKLLSNTLYELGYRTKAIKNTIIDIAFFSQTFENSNNHILISAIPDFANNVISFNHHTENLPLTIRQKGVTVALQTNLFNQKVQLRPHLTIQETKLEGYSPYYAEKGIYAGDIYTLSDQYSKSTPDIFAGMNIIITPIQKLSIGISAYYYSDYELHLSSEFDNQTGIITHQPTSDIKSKLTLNTNVSYSFTPMITAFVNARNITNRQAPEAFASDYLGSLYMAGVNFNY